MKIEQEPINGQVEARSRRSSEVVAKPSRRRFTEAYIDAILKELDAARHGEVGKILRREGLYTKQVARWRAERSTGVQPKRGRKPSASSDVRKELARQEREIARLRRKLEQAEIIIEVQKKVAALLNTMDTTEESR
jgi:transposase